MTKFKIAVIQGDGIGPEVVAEGVKVLKLLAKRDDRISFEMEYFPWGCKYYLKEGKMMPENGIEILSDFDAIYLGAVGFPDVPDHISLWGLLLKIRKSFKQYVNLRPIVLLDDSVSPLKDKKTVDMLFIRENNEGEYAGSGAWLYEDSPEEVVIQHSVFSRKNTERIMRYAFRLAERENKKLTSISKANALNYSMVFWDEVFEKLKQEFPTVKTETLLVDAASMLMVTQPERFEVVVTTNLFGDILTDLGAAITGGLGLAAGANINPDKNYPAMFEPIHGSAPDLTNRGIANPLAAIWSVSQMLDYFGYSDLGKTVFEAIQEVIREKQLRTRDIGGTATTQEMGKAVRDKMIQLLNKE